MSKWSTYRKRSGSRWSGAQPAPGVNDWSAAQGAAEHITLTRVAAIPPTAVGWSGRWKAATSSTWQAWTALGATPYDLNWGASGQAVNIQIAWNNGAVHTSEGSDVKTVTTL